MTSSSSSSEPAFTPGPFDRAFLDDLFYAPSVLFLDRLEVVDAAASRVVARMPTDGPMPFTDAQRTDAVRHPRHVAGAVMVHVTGMLGWAHAYYLEGLRHKDGWVGYGTHIHKAVFRKLVAPGPPLSCACTQLRLRRMKGKLFGTYAFEFHQEGELAYESEQQAIWLRPG